MKHICLALSLLAGSLLCAPISTAQTAFDLTVSPPTAYLNLLPGTQGSHVITLTNNSQSDLRIIPKLVDSQPADFTSVPQLSSALTFPYLAKDKTNLEPLVIPPESTGVLTLFFDVPSNAMTSEYSLTALFASSQVDADSSANTLSLNNSGSLVTGAVASNIVVFVGEQSPDPQLQIIDAGAPLIIDSLRPLDINPIVRNFGPHAMVASGSAEIRDWRNQLLMTAQLFPAVVLADQTQRLMVLPENTPSGEIPEPTSLSYRSLLLLGPIQVQIHLSDTSGRVYAISQSTVYALPISIIASIVGVIILIWLFRRYIHHYWEQYS